MRDYKKIANNIKNNLTGEIRLKYKMVLGCIYQLVHSGN